MWDVSDCYDSVNVLCNSCIFQRAQARILSTLKSRRLGSGFYLAALENCTHPIEYRPAPGTWFNYIVFFQIIAENPLKAN